MRITDALRKMVTDLGGTPKSNTIKGLVTEATAAAGGTTVGHSTSERIKELEEAITESEGTE